MAETLYTIGFRGRTAEDFFTCLRSAGVKMLVDIRLRNNTQLAGFTKRTHLPFFLREVLGCGYEHRMDLAPDEQLLADWNNRRESGLTWERYERRFLALLESRNVLETLSMDLFTGPSALLCAEREPDQCHRRLVAEYLAEKCGGLEVRHLQ